MSTSSLPSADPAGLTPKLVITMEPAVALDPRKKAPAPGVPPMELAFGFPRNFLDNRYVYVVISPRARGLTLGVNLTPARTCTFDCAYCEVKRDEPVDSPDIDLETLEKELYRTLAFVESGHIRRVPSFAALPNDLLQLRHVALSGDGEPTLCPRFAEVVETVVHVRALGRFPFFKMVLLTNATGLDLPPVQQGLKLFTKQDEVWAKLDAGTQEYMHRINRPRATLEKVLANILSLARQRPVVIQSLFCTIAGQEPSELEIQQYAERLKELTERGAKISLVQIYSAVRPTANSGCGHLPLKSLSRIAAYVKKTTGLAVEVF
ncbi:MAG: radical SAM protein [Verrucomicrobia bacterium]|nr:radical SAM protein [Verrucomicrobiota bacterium]